MKMKTIDLRSDTVTKPTAQMYQAMVDAPVGDDVFGDDPTVIALEKRTAEILGKEAAIYMPSGTMCIQAAIRAHTEPGDEILTDVNSHVYLYESGGPAALSGVTCNLLPGVRGIFSTKDVKAALRAKHHQICPGKLLMVENTHNKGGGTVWPIESIAEVAQAARDANMKLHMDGARLWNAAAASGVPESEYARHFDSINVCFSKGLGSPVGAALVGTSQFIERARRFRQMFGGGMRQAGVIAAGALYALENNRQRLTEDHANAKKLATALAQIPGIELNTKSVESNIIFFKVSAMSANQLAETLRSKDVLVLVTSADTIRAVTHLDVSAAQIDEAISIFENIPKT